MPIFNATGRIECDECLSNDIAIVDLIEMANGTWGFDESVQLETGWTAVLVHGNTYRFKCPDCNKADEAEKEMKDEDNR